MMVMESIDGKRVSRNAGWNGIECSGEMPVYRFLKTNRCAKNNTCRFWAENMDRFVEPQSSSQWSKHRRIRLRQFSVFLLSGFRTGKQKTKRLFPNGPES